MTDHKSICLTPGAHHKLWIPTMSVSAVIMTLQNLIMSSCMSHHMQMEHNMMNLWLNKIMSTCWTPPAHTWSAQVVQICHLRTCEVQLFHVETVLLFFFPWFCIWSVCECICPHVSRPLTKCFSSSMPLPFLQTLQTVFGIMQSELERWKAPSALHGGTEQKVSCC